MRRIVICVILLAALVTTLAGCSGFDNEYIVINEYIPPVQEAVILNGKVNVHNFSGLKQALLNMAYAGVTEGTIVFDSAYDGDTTSDMASACWNVRTQDALCAYCVENIAYELNKIVTINEASIYISYSDSTESAEDIRRLSFSSGIENVLLKAMKSGTQRIAVLIGHSDFSADDMAGEIEKLYRKNPMIVPKAPSASVNMFSGTGSQRLYEISIDYGMSIDEMSERMAQLEALNVFDGLSIESLPPSELAREALDYLAASCAISEDGDDNNVYSALIRHCANSEGMAFAYVELCRQLGLECIIVYGQYEWKEHCWNIVNIDGSYYHVDIYAAIKDGAEGSFLKNDEQFWGSYRWDVASYPACTGKYYYESNSEKEETESDLAGSL